MHLVLATDDSFWNNARLETCFIRALDNLLSGLKNKAIPDVFFPEVGHVIPYLNRIFLDFFYFKLFGGASYFQVNLLDRIKSDQVLKDNIGYLDNILKRYERTRDVMDMFKAREEASLCACQ